MAKIKFYKGLKISDVWLAYKRCHKTGWK